PPESCVSNRFQHGIGFLIKNLECVNSVKNQRQASRRTQRREQFLKKDFCKKSFFKTALSKEIPPAGWRLKQSFLETSDGNQENKKGRKRSFLKVCIAGF
ncbi:MAG: hypothetical protein AAB316_06530, partial [Bacteroidota bacterium]